MKKSTPIFEGKYPYSPMDRAKSEGLKKESEDHGREFKDEGGGHTEDVRTGLRDQARGRRFEMPELICESARLNQLSNASLARRQIAVGVRGEAGTQRATG